jgi:integrase
MSPVEAFLAWCSLGNYSPMTVRNYRSLLSRFEQAVGDPLTATSAQVAGWLAGFGDCAPATRRAARCALSSFYRWAIEIEECAVRSPMGKIPPVKVPQPAPRPIDPIRLAIALELAEPRMRCWLLLGMDAGLRRAEIAMVRREDIHGRNLVVTGKGGKTGIVPMSTRLAVALQGVDVAHGRLWNVGAEWVGRSIAAHLRACGIEATAHQLRHSFACRLYTASGGDLLKTSRLMRHADVRTTQRYALDDGDDGLMDRLDAA